MSDKPGLSVIKARTPSPRVIETLETLLEHAKTGELTALVWIAAWHAEYTSYGWEADKPINDYQVLGAMTCATQEISLKIMADVNDARGK